MFKFNNGNGAIICNRCNIIIQTPITPEESKMMSYPKKSGAKDLHYCETHMPNKAGDTNGKV